MSTNKSQREEQKGRELAPGAITPSSKRLTCHQGTAESHRIRHWQRPEQKAFLCRKREGDKGERETETVRQTERREREISKPKSFYK